MVNLYHKSQQSGENGAQSKTKIHSFASTGRLRSKSSIEFSFENDWKIPLSTTVGAVLHVISVDDLRSKLMQYNIPASSISIRLYQRRKRGGYKLVSKAVSDLTSDYVTLDLQRYIRRHMTTQLMLTLRSESGVSIPASFLLLPNSCITPFLVLHTEEVGDTDIVNEMADRPWPSDKGSPRAKRRSNNKSWPRPLLYKDVTLLEKGITYSCRKEDLWINFNEIGWDWIITPKYVNIGDCGGLCLDADNNIAHAVVKQLLQNMKPASNAGMLCCQGANYKEITALYFKSKHEIVIRSIPKIVVKECRCR